MIQVSLFVDTFATEISLVRLEGGLYLEAAIWYTDLIEGFSKSRVVTADRTPSDASSTPFPGNVILEVSGGVEDVNMAAVTHKPTRWRLRVSGHLS